MARDSGKGLSLRRGLGFGMISEARRGVRVARAAPPSHTREPNDPGMLKPHQSAPSLPPWPLRRRMLIQRRSGEKTSVQRENQGVQVGPGPLRQGRDRLFKPPAWRHSAALRAHTCRCDPVSGSGDHCLCPREQRLRYLAWPHSGVLKPDQSGHGTTAETRDLMDRGSVSSAHRPTCTDLRGAPTRHSPF